jgi:hypothetical protein
MSVLLDVNLDSLLSVPHATRDEHFEQAGLSRWIEPREGDLRETPRRLDRLIDFMLVNIGISMARLALPGRGGPKGRRDDGLENAARHCDACADYFAFIDDPENGFRTMTLPSDGGLELSVRGPP